MSGRGHPYYQYRPNQGPSGYCIPAHYKEEVEKQIQIMLDNHIIEPSSSPWMALQSL